MRLKKKKKTDYGKKIISTPGILLFTIFGMVFYLLTFLGVAFSEPKTITTSALMIGSIGGTIIVGGFITAILLIFKQFYRYLK